MIKAIQVNLKKMVKMKWKDYGFRELLPTNKITLEKNLYQKLFIK